MDINKLLIAVKVNSETVVIASRVLRGIFNKESSLNEGWITKHRNSIGYLYIRNGRLDGWNPSSSKSYYPEYIQIDTTQSKEFNIKLDGKDIDISKESFEAIRKALGV
jgi:hypothetical protein